jgi:sugar-phosphatase
MPLVMVTGDEVERGKPDPEPYLTAARRTATDPANCVVVEDSPAGIASGKAAGMRVAAVMTTHRGFALAEADVVLFQLSDLPRLLRRWDL